MVVDALGDALVDALVDMRDRCYCHLDDMGNSRPMVATHTPAMALRHSQSDHWVCWHKHHHCGYSQRPTVDDRVASRDSVDSVVDVVNATDNAPAAFRCH